MSGDRRPRKRGTHLTMTDSRFQGCCKMPSFLSHSNPEHHKSPTISPWTIRREGHLCYLVEMYHLPRSCIDASCHELPLAHNIVRYKSSHQPNRAVLHKPPGPDPHIYFLEPSLHTPDPDTLEVTVARHVAHMLQGQYIVLCLLAGFVRCSLDIQQDYVQGSTYSD